MNTCYVLIGPPGAGKSYYTEKLLETQEGNCAVLSCDTIREQLFGKPYKFTKENEDKVWKCFYKMVEAASQSYNLIIDNTNCKFIYIQRIKEKLHPDCKVEYIYFDVPLWKLYWRNFLRWIRRDKFVPYCVVKAMWINFNKLKKK